MCRKETPTKCRRRQDHGSNDWKVHCDCCSEGRFDVLVRELSNVQESGCHRSKLKLRAREFAWERCPSATMLDRSRVGARHPGDSPRDAEQPSAGGCPTNPGGCVELRPRVIGEVGAAEVLGEFEECSTWVLSGTGRMHVRAFQDYLGRCCHHRAFVRSMHEFGSSDVAERDLNSTNVCQVDSDDILSGASRQGAR